MSAAQVEDVFEVEREGEVARYGAGGSILPNRKLLWHGSRLSNYAGALPMPRPAPGGLQPLADAPQPHHCPRVAGILSQGLRIAPPEAPATGYMFGKGASRARYARSRADAARAAAGVYFADRVTKSANYCATNSTNPTGLMLLCDVALGDMNEKLYADIHADQLPPGKHSTWGIGAMRPDPEGNVVREDGTEVPMGKTQNAGKKHSLLCASAATAPPRPRPHGLRRRALPQTTSSWCTIWIKSACATWSSSSFTTAERGRPVGAVLGRCPAPLPPPAATVGHRCPAAAGAGNPLRRCGPRP